MAQYISPEQRAKILSAIKDEGMNIGDASKTFLVAEKTIRTWMKKQTKNAHTSSTEVQKLRQELQLYKEIIADLVVSQAKKKKSTFLGS